MSRANWKSQLMCILNKFLHGRLTVKKKLKKKHRISPE